jgi:hypothetical protein
LQDVSHHEDIAISQDYFVPDASLLDELLAYHDVAFEEEAAASLSSFAPCVGDECESEEHDCVIPEEYKTLSDEAANEVLNFLGIRRAEPLRPDRRGARDWE